MKGLRHKVKCLKAFQGVSYKELAEYLEIRPDSFRHWLKGQYELCPERAERLKEIIDTMHKQQEVR